VFVSNQGIESTRSCNDDIWVCVLVFQSGNILVDFDTSIEDSSLDLWHVFAESSVLIFDLICKLSSMTHDQDRGLARDWLGLLKSCKDKDGGFTKTGFGLTEHIGSEDCLRNADLLDCRGSMPC
jgi:hypothetical protein